MANGLIHNRFNWLGLNKKYKSIYKTQNPQKSKVLFVTALDLLDNFSIVVGILLIQKLFIHLVDYDLY